MTLTTFQKGKIDAYLEKHSESLFKTLCEKHKVNMDNLDDADPHALFNLVTDLRADLEGTPAYAPSGEKQAATTTAKVLQEPKAQTQKTFTPQAQTSTTTKEKNCLKDWIELIKRKNTKTNTTIEIPHIPVRARLIYFSLKYPLGGITIDTQPLGEDKIMIRAKLSKDNSGGEFSNVPFSDASIFDLKSSEDKGFEKAVTDAKGRVLFSAGIGIIGSPINDEKFSELATVGVKPREGK